MTLETGVQNTWCPGCGNFAILAAAKSVMEKLIKEGEKQENFASIYTEKVDWIPIKYELEDFISSINNDRTPMSDVVSGAKTIATLMAGLESQKKGAPVKVEEVE